MKTALVTGSSGFVGRHLLEALAFRGYGVTPCDVKDGRGDTNSWNDARVLARQENERYDLVVHCAAVVGGRTKIDGAPLEVAYDFGLDSDVIQFCARTRPGRVVLFSSSAAYPTIYQEPGVRMILEEGMFGGSEPDAIYGLCKYTLEYQARELAKLGIPTHVFRPFSGYGSDQDDDYPWPAIMKRALAGEDPFDVWCEPRQTRDWIHIDDIVAQVFACIDADERGPINLCTGEGTEFATLAHVTVDLARRARRIYPDGAPRFRFRDDMPFGVHYRVGDPTRINRICPATINVVDGIKRSLAELA